MAKSPDSRRIADLERQLAALTIELRQSALQAARGEVPQAVRLAKTVAPPEDTYPSASTTPNTYPIVFLNGTFDQEPGNQSPTFVERQSEACTVAQNVSQNQYFYVPENTIVAVWKQRGRWRFDYSLANISPVTLGSTLADGASVSVTLVDGRTVTATNSSGQSLSAGHALAAQGLDANWYLTGAGSGGGGGGSTSIMHGIVSAAAAILPGAAGNVTTGSGVVSATNQSDVSMFPGDLVTVYEESSTWYAINYGIEMYPISGGCPSPGVAQGANITVTLPDGRSVSALNTASHTIVTTAPIHVYLNRFTGGWIVIPADTIVPRIFKALINDATGMDPADTNGTIDNIIMFDQGPVPQVTGKNISVIDNPLKLSANDNDVVIVQQDLTGSLSPLGWFALAVMGKFRRRVKGLINNGAGLLASDANATIDTITTFDGSTAPTITTAANFLGFSGKDNDIVILEEVVTASPTTWFVAHIQSDVGVTKIYKALLNGGLASATTPATIDTVKTLAGGTGPTVTSAENYLGWAGADNDPCLILDDGSGAYVLLSVKWSVVTTVTDSLIDAANMKIQKKTTDVLTKPNAAQSGATDIDTGQSC